MSAGDPMPVPPSTGAYGPPPERWTRLTLADSEYGESSILVRDADLTATAVLQDLVLPVLASRGYRNVERWLERFDAFLESEENDPPA